MKVKVLNEQGYYEALFGIGLSYGITSDKELKDLTDTDWYKLEKIANKLCNKQGGHNKFLESIQVWLDITAPRYWWQQAATYRVGTSTQSSSTMHTLTIKKLTQSDFERVIPSDLLLTINNLVESKEFDLLKNILPEGFLQRRIVSTNYKVIQHMIMQRKNHKLSEWHVFIDCMRRQLINFKFLEGV